MSLSSPRGSLRNYTPQRASSSPTKRVGYGAANLLEARHQVQTLYLPPPPLTVSQWADRERRLSSESSAEPGEWRTARAPYQRGIMDAVTDPMVREIWVMKSAQIGWTEILNNVIGYHIDQDRAPILLVQPTLEMAEAWSKDRLAPMLRDTPALRAKIADAKARDSGNTLLHKTFDGGHLTIAGANSPAGLASRPIRIVLFDEVDRFPASAGAEGDPIALGRKRTTTFWNRRMLAGSTPTIKGSSRIEQGFDNSDQRYYFVPCPHCDEMQRLVWANVRWPEGRPSEACYVCAHCGAEIYEPQKAEMLVAGEWRALKESRGIAGFHISEIYSPWASWGELAVSFLEAKRLPETLQAWTNMALGETWENQGDTIESAGLISRRESYTDNSLPPGVLLVTMGTDVQDDRLESTIWGWGAEQEAWKIAHLVLRGDPASDALWREHDELLRRRLPTDDGRLLGIESCCIDSGGHFTENVYRYCAKRKRARVWAIKGQGGQGRLVWPKRPGRGRKINVDVWLIGVDTVKDLLYSRVKKVIAPGPGYLHFDATTEPEWFDQFASETVVHKISMGRRVRMWRPRATGTRQEALDCTVYAYAAMIGRGGDAVLAFRAARNAKQAEQTQATEPAATAEQTVAEPEPATPPTFDKPRPRRAPRRSWVKDWRR
jgi:phage terminase large subunit GpA-like protein